MHTRAAQETASADGAEEPAQWSLYIEASDTGQGMSQEVAESIFEPFFTTKAEQGNGLGLATVASIVAQAEGQIKVRSELNAGTTFTICLPAIWVEPIEEEPPQPAPRIEASGDTAATILVAEDELAIQALMSRILERAGYTVLMGSSAEKAIEMSDGHEGHVDLLLTDVVMTGMNGRELADAMQARRPGVAVLFMSGFDGARCVSEASTRASVSWPSPSLAKSSSTQLRRH
jgi:two-component system cell cycle sensor histidine kinase/response regulator CckA